VTDISRASKDTINTRWIGWTVWIAATLAMTGVLLWPAFWNGFPLIFPDTGGYLLRPLEGTLGYGRSAFYGAFLAAGMPLDFWPNIVVQALVTVFLIRTLVKADDLDDGSNLVLVITLALAALSSLPWYVSQLMPDVLVGWAVIALYLLTFRRDALGPFEMATLIAIVACAMASHMAILALSLGLFACVLLMRIVAPRIGLLRPRLAAPALAVATGILLCPVSTYLVTGKFAFTPGGSTFIFGRLVQDGLVQRYLDDHCPDKTVKLCRYENDVPDTADEWLWTGTTPLYKLGGWKGFRPEAERLIVATLRLYPYQHVRTALEAALDQFLMFRTQLSVKPGVNIHVVATFGEQLSAGANARFLAARQQRDKPDIAILNVLHVPIAAVSLSVIAFIAVFNQPKWTDTAMRALCATVLLALIGNAVICGVLSNPNDRYQNRLIWLAVLAAALVAAQWRRARTATAGKQDALKA
jgi:hypothetical protein